MKTTKTDELRIENIEISKIVPYENNPRHNDSAVDQVANSIREFGFKVPIIIDKDNVIVCGHTRYKASKQLGLKKIPCIRADDLTDDQIKAFRIADNNIPNYQILARSTGGAQYNVNGTNIRLSATQVADLTKYGELNYIGGKHGGQAYGAGTYFDMNGGFPTGYARGGGETLIGVLSKTAKPISENQLYRATAQWVQSHPKFARAVGSINSSNESIYALAQGYNVITDGGSYHNVIDRSALVLRKSNY